MDKGTTELVLIQKFLKYYWFILLVSILVVKYRFLIWVLSDRALIETLEKRFDALKRRKLRFSAAHTAQIIIQRVNAVLRRLYPRTRCLVRSVVLNETLMLSGHTDQKIKFGVKFDDDRLLAHAWIDRDEGYEKLYDL